MAGTARSRISVFMRRFGNLNLIEISEAHPLIIKENDLTAYLASIAWPCCLPALRIGCLFR
ncbi:MAG TPA: hypothetical protein VJ464_26875 [Blastocatellia bacterium]|nr:hypothetical protein [Blastocatellia bacterium]